MNKLMIASAVAAPLVAGAAGFGGYKMAQQQELQAQNDGMAELVTAVPSMHDVRVAVPRQECRNVPIQYTETRERNRSSVGTDVAVGSVIGGVLGHAVTRGHSRNTGTLAGAALGGYLGYNHAQQNNRPETVNRVRYEQRCNTVNDYRTEQRNNGYNVTYRYQGQVFTTQMASVPPARFPVNINVTPSSGVSQPAG